MVSESYLLVYGASGELLSKTLFRRDAYACVQGRVQRAPQPSSEEKI